MYSLVYDGESETYNFTLLDDMDNGELRIAPLNSEFIVGRHVDHRFATCLCTVIYDYEIEDDEPNHVCKEPLLEDYQNCDIRLLL